MLISYFWPFCIQNQRKKWIMKSTLLMKNYPIIRFCWNTACTIEIYWTCISHKKITSLMYIFWEILININLFRSIYNQLSPDIIKMNTMYDFVFYLNLKFWQVFNKIDSLEYVIQFLLRLDHFKMKNMTSNRKNICYEK